MPTTSQTVLQLISEATSVIPNIIHDETSEVEDIKLYTVVMLSKYYGSDYWCYYNFYNGVINSATIGIACLIIGVVTVSFSGMLVWSYMKKKRSNTNGNLRLIRLVTPCMSPVY